MMREKQFRAGAPLRPVLSTRSANIRAVDYDLDLTALAKALNAGSTVIHAANIRAGWWSDPRTGKPVARNAFEVLALVHSEISEAVEAHRKGLPDDKLPDLPGIAVELADALLRILDTAAALGLPIGDVLARKARFNLIRKDHTLEARLAPGGKAV